MISEIYKGRSFSFHNADSSVRSSAEENLNIFCKREILIKLFYLYQRFEYRDNYFFKINLLLSALWNENDLPLYISDIILLSMSSILDFRWLYFFGAYLPANNLRIIYTIYVRGYLQGSENGRVVTIACKTRYHFAILLKLFAWS
jgi:hypothetical protein